MKRSTNRWVILFGSFIVYLFDAMEIVILSFALPAVRQEFGATAVQAGMLATATLIGIGVSALVMGWLADVWGRRKTLILCLALFGVFTALLAIAPSLLVMGILRFLSGLGLGGVWGIVSALVVESWPPQSRAKAVSFVLSSFPVGAAVASVAAGIFLPDWRLMFLVTGVSVLLPLAIVVFLFSESTEWLRTRDELRAAGGRTKVPLARIFERGYARVTVLASIVASLAFIAYYGASTWLPSYLINERGLSSRTVGVFMTVLNLGMFLGYFAFGWLADRIGKRNALVLSFFGTGVLMPLYGLATNQTMLLWLGPAYAFFMTFSGLFGSYLGEVYPTEFRTTGANFCFNVGRGVSAFAPVAIGSFAASQGLSSGLILSGGLFLAAGVVMIFLPRTERAARVHTAPSAEESHA
ncbi:MFS transporter [Enemella evansiae]|uniref:MFS transporter n=1 Tax=Enemella evansiae TaxID=2016499 RepID=A0A255GCA1_9ACTN|nr:MFS transporter [Enemella evansiae]OYN95579.1 MFS transporter [Enemella evansiae]OYO00326.1 MFS transporter [Enemella evansiae]OYO03684.1 MFS transporter [Enemella evansiae]OYO10110.1 MFS transporter [Enemella evansiae]OYO13455.1 MFS transporter [Enemella evansiae]